MAFLYACLNSTSVIDRRRHLFLQQVRNRGGALTTARRRDVVLMKMTSEVGRETVPSRAWRDAVAAAMEDHVQSGRNICIGDGPKELLVPFLDAVDVHVHAESLIDVAFVATTSSNVKLLSDRHLPTDLAVNFKQSIDVYIAPVTTVDAGLNVALPTNAPAAEAAAVQLAHRCVFLINEAQLPHDYNNKQNNHNHNTEDRDEEISVLRVELAPFQPLAVVRSLSRDTALRALGVDRISLVDGYDEAYDSSSPILADVHLRQGAPLVAIHDELRRHATILGVALHPASRSTILLVAAEEEDGHGTPYEITPGQDGLALMPDDRRRAAISFGELDQAMRTLSGWRIQQGSNKVNALVTRFVFSDVLVANTFIRLTHELSLSARHYPEIRQGFTNVRICLSNYDAGGITHLDLQFARQLSLLHRSMTQI